MLTGINHCEKALVKKDKKEAIMYKAEHVFSKANNIIWVSQDVALSSAQNILS